MTKTVLVEKKSQGVVEVRLNKPEKHNAFDENLILELTKILQQLNHDQDVRIVILTAEGRNFCAGADLDWMRKTMNYSEQENIQDAKKLADLLHLLFFFSKPLIALCHGAVYGGGVGLISCCDIVIATDTTRFCFSETKLGLIPATIAPYIISAIGARAANYYFLTTDLMTAHQAQQLGLIQQVVSEDLLTKTSDEMIAQMLQNSPAALVRVKELIRHFNHIDDSIINTTTKMLAQIRVSPEAQEGMQAFLEKRKPNWIS